MKINRPEQTDKNTIMQFNLKSAFFQQTQNVRRGKVGGSKCFNFQLFGQHLGKTLLMPFKQKTRRTKRETVYFIHGKLSSFALSYRPF